MKEWLTASPDVQIVHVVTGCRLSIDDRADRPARALSNGDLLDPGGRRVRFIDTPHVPHGLDAGVIYEEETSTLFCGDLFAHGGNGPALTTSDILAPATARGMGQYTSLTPGTSAIIQGLARLAPTTLAVMHGTSFKGDGGAALAGLANHYMARLEASREVVAERHTDLASREPVASGNWRSISSPPPQADPRSNWDVTPVIRHSRPRCFGRFGIVARSARCLIRTCGQTSSKAPSPTALYRVRTVSASSTLRDPTSDPCMGYGASHSRGLIDVRQIPWIKGLFSDRLPQQESTYDPCHAATVWTWMTTRRCSEHQSAAD